MTNDEKNVTALLGKLAIRASSFLRHSTFVLRRAEASENARTPPLFYAASSSNS